MILRRFAMAAALAGAASGLGCSKVLLGDGSSSIVIVDSLVAASGASPLVFNGALASDVQTLVQGQPTVFEDIGQVTLELALKDPGTSTTPAAPTTANYVTVTRYHIDYTIPGKTTTPGVDVPASVDSGITMTVGNQPVTSTFILVLKQAKTAPPLLALVGGAGEVATVATITFYGTDQTGHTVTATATIAVNFADWPDPAS